MDYRGYGGNPGHPSQQGLARDVRAARAYLASTAGYPPERTIYFGESLGAAVVTELVTEPRRVTTVGAWTRWQHCSAGSARPRG